MKAVQILDNLHNLRVKHVDVCLRRDPTRALGQCGSVRLKCLGLKYLRNQSLVALKVVKVAMRFVSSGLHLFYTLLFWPCEYDARERYLTCLLFFVQTMPVVAGYLNLWGDA
jgi:hypothetical protein